jgi:sec-independent protein translocase protein TatC
MLLLGGAAAWRLGTVVVLAAGILGTLVALRLTRGPRAAQDPTTMRMKLWGHVAELRDRILWCAGTWMAATMVAFSFRVEARSWGYTLVPALHDNIAAQLYRVLADLLVPDGVRLVVLRPLDGFAAEFTIAMDIGFAVALPVLLWHAAAFIGPALKPRERRTLRLALLPAVALFLAGATFAGTVLAPILLETLYAYAEPLGAEPFLQVGELVSFTVTLALVFGLASLTPIAMAGLAAAGLVTWRGFLKGWRHAVVAIVVLCALVTDGTLVTLAMVAMPLIGLYFVGVGLAAWTGRGAPH